LEIKLATEQDHSSHVTICGNGRKGLAFQALLNPTNGDEKKPERTDTDTKAIIIDGKGYKTIKKMGKT
jgi:hypothetical protein